MSDHLPDNVIIYTNGAFLKPIKQINSEGQEYWLWAVTEFNDDSYRDGEIFNPAEFASTLEELLKDDSKNE